MNPSRKRICLIINSLVGGGAERKVLTIAKAVVSLGHDAHVVMLNDRVAYPVPEGVHTHAVYPARVRHLDYFWRIRRTARDLHGLIERIDPSIDFKQRVRFALAAYNAGWGHVIDARRLAAQKGWDPDRWFGNVEKAMLLLAQPRYHKRARYGYCRGQEPVTYVSNIQLYYDNYVALLP